MKGTNILLWRYRDERMDSTFAYVPAIRRVRRMSPANRSDAFLGSDFCVDDAWGYGGKINAFTWKVIKKTDQLLPCLPGQAPEDRQERRGRMGDRERGAEHYLRLREGRVSGRALVAAGASSMSSGPRTSWSALPRTSITITGPSSSGSMRAVTRPPTR